MPYVNINDIDEVNKYKKHIYSSEYGSIRQDISEDTKNISKQYAVYLEKNDVIYASMKIDIVSICAGLKIALVENGPVCDFYDVKIVEQLISEAKLMLKTEKVSVVAIVLKPQTVYDEKLKALYSKLGYQISQLPSKQIIEDLPNATYCEKVLSNIQKGLRKKYVLREFELASEFILPNELVKYLDENTYKLLETEYTKCKKYAKVGFEMITLKNMSLGYIMYCVHNKKMEIIIDKADNVYVHSMLLHGVIERAKKYECNMLHLTNSFDTAETKKIKLDFSCDNREYFETVIKKISRVKCFFYNIRRKIINGRI